MKFQIMLVAFYICDLPRRNLLRSVWDLNIVGFTPVNMRQSFFKFDAEQLNRYLSLDSLLNTDNTYTSSIAHALAEQIHKSFDYKIKSDSVENNSAKVVVKITSTDFTSILETYQKQISEWVQSSDALEAGLLGRHEKGREFLLKAIQDNTATTSETVEISLTNDGTSWKMQMDQNLAQAILGGVSSTLADVQEDVE